jgi:hypothetical protein
MCEMFHKLPLHSERLKNKRAVFRVERTPAAVCAVKRGSGENLLPKPSVAPMLGNRPKRE